MEHNRKQKLLMIIALIVAIASLSIGFSAFSTTLNISSSASVTPNSDTFSVKFSTSQNSLVVEPLTPTGATANIEAGTGTINNTTNPTVTGLSASFTAPGQYISYTFYARNEGEYTAYLNNINFIGEKVCTAGEGTSEQLVQSACEKVTLYVQVGTNGYFETTPITGHSLAPNASDKIQVILNYESDATLADGPFTVQFQDVALVYSTIDDSTFVPEKIVKLESGDLNTPGSIVSIGDEQFYVFGQEDGNVKLLSMYNLYVGNSASIDEESRRTVVPLSNPTGIQNSQALGYFYGYSEEKPIIGVTPFSSDSQKGTNYSDYNGSIVEGYVNNYASYLEGLGATIEEARLITVEELVTLGCDRSGSVCVEAPEFVYKTSYWTGVSQNEDMVIRVDSGRVFAASYYYNKYDYGVRPVIEISLSEF